MRIRASLKELDDYVIFYRMLNRYMNDCIVTLRSRNTLTIFYCIS